MKQPPCFLTVILLAFTSVSLFGQTGSFQFDGILRDYIVHEPIGYDDSTALPLVINMHGYGSNAFQQAFYSNMNPVADSENFFVVYPNGVSNEWNVGFQGQDYLNGTDDVGFISALIDTIMNSYAIDPARVYSTGMSNGGFMSYRLACDLNNRIAAIASVTGSMTNIMASNCTNPPPFPIMEIHGTLDSIVPYEGGGAFLHIDSVVQFWVTNNLCNPLPVVEDLPDNVNSDGSTITKYAWNNCDGSTRVVLLKVINGEHTWPGAPINIGITCMDINGSQAIWDFFNQIPIGTQTPDHQSFMPISSINILNNPVNDFLEIEYVAASGGQLKIVDIQGKIVFQEYTSTTFSIGKIRVKTHNFKAGFYLLQFQTDESTETIKFMKP